MAQAENAKDKRVILTGGTGFVGTAVLRRLVSQGYHPVCLVRDPQGIRIRLPGRYTAVTGSLSDDDVLRRCAEGAAACIHLVGIIMERHARRQTFQRVHVEGTRRLVEACGAGGVRRIVHMSALGSRPDAPSTYHRTKFQAEEILRNSGLDWTIFQPSIIHGPDGEFMRMLRDFSCHLLPPFMPYFGVGLARVQPVYVEDVAQCFVQALSLRETINKTFPMGGPEAMTWRELYDAAAMAFRGRPQLKIGVPVLLARAIGRFADLHDLILRTRRPLFLLPPIPFNRDQVLMSQQDSICDPSIVEQTFGIKLADFRKTLADYADLVG